MLLGEGKAPLRRSFPYRGRLGCTRGPTADGWEISPHSQGTLVDTSALSGSKHSRNDHLCRTGGEGCRGAVGGHTHCACWHSASGHGGFGSPWPGIWSCGLDGGGNPWGRSAARLSLPDVPGQRPPVTAPGWFNALKDGVKINFVRS